MSFLGINLSNDGGAASLGISGGANVFGTTGGLTPTPREAASSFDEGDALDWAKILAPIGVAIYQQQNRSDLQGQLIASGQSGTVTQGVNGATNVATGVGVVSGTSLFGGAGGSTILNIPILYWVMGLIILLILKR